MEENQFGVSIPVGMVRFCRLVTKILFPLFIILLWRCSGLPSAPDVLSGRPNAAEMEFVWCPPGTFTMGAVETEAGSISNERPVRQVKLEGFWISKFEITQQDWGKYFKQNPSEFKGLLRPVERVSLYDALAFIDTLNKRFTPLTFRLPTEAEWEYACRAGTTTPFYWGDGLDTSLTNRSCWSFLNSNNETHDIGMKTPNNWKIYDMCGNVSEWVQDLYKLTYSLAPIDGGAVLPVGPDSTSNDPDHPDAAYYVLRGGNFNWTPAECRSAARYAERPGDRHMYNGFRIVHE
jgi:formylglycine-generating enzyme required for sulfatase activity